jgi:hypothetical protein
MKKAVELVTLAGARLKATTCYAEDKAISEGLDAIYLVQTTGIERGS